MSVVGSTVLRRPWRAAFGAALLGVVDALLLALLWSATSLGGDAFFGAALTVMLYGTVGTALARVEVDRDGIVVRNGWRVRRLPWRQIAFISPATDDRAHRSVGVAMLGGPRVRCFAVGSMRWETVHSPVQRRVYETLHAQLVAARADGRAPSGD